MLSGTVKKDAYFNKNVHYLRGLLAIVVVFTHFKFLIFRHLAGAVAVDVFFIISGYVIASSVDKYRSAENRIKTAVHFMSRRFLRLFPAYIVCLLLMFSLSEKFSLKDLILSLFFLNGYIGIEFPIFTAWSLVYEVNFYIIYGFFILIGWQDRFKWYLVVTGVFGTLWNSGYPLLEYFISPFNIYFYLGMELRKKVPTIRKNVLLIGLLMFSFILLVSNDAVKGQIVPKEIISISLVGKNFQISRIIAWGWGAYMVFVISHEWFRFSSESIIKTFLSFFADISYSLYLIHSLVVSFYSSLIRKGFIVDSFKWQVVFIFISILASYFIHVTVESPVICLIQNRIDKWFLKTHY